MSSESGESSSSSVQLMPLAGAHSGSQVRLVSVQAGHDLRARLAGMGLVPGMKLRIIRNTGGGPLVVQAHGARLALGRGMVHRMLVSPVAE